MIDEIPLYIGETTFRNPARIHSTISGGMIKMVGRHIENEERLNITVGNAKVSVIPIGDMAVIRVKTRNGYVANLSYLGPDVNGDLIVTVKARSQYASPLTA
jgi:hypothetical protein